MVLSASACSLASSTKWPPPIMRAFKTAVIRRLVNPPFLLLALCLKTFFVRPEWPCFPGHEDPEKKNLENQIVRSQIISDDQPHFTSRRRRDSVLSETELVHGSVGAPCKFKEMTSEEFDLSFLPACRA